MHPSKATRETLPLDIVNARAAYANSIPSKLMSCAPAAKATRGWVEDITTSSSVANSSGGR